MKYLKKYENLNLTNIENSYISKNVNVDIYEDEKLKSEFNISEDDDLTIQCQVKWNNYLTEDDDSISLSPQINEIKLNLLIENNETRIDREEEIILTDKDYTFNSQFYLIDDSSDFKSYFSINIKNVEIYWVSKKVNIVF